MATYKTYHSEQDRSVNFVFGKDKELLESRFVRREQDYFIVYVSSHTGCNKSCRFCHLTATKQTSFRHTTPREYGEQAKAVIDHYKSIIATQGAANRVNFNFMARGEPLANRYVLHDFDSVYNRLVETLDGLDIDHKLNISTIMPVEVEEIDLTDTFGSYPVVLYYSLYSLDTKFRKRWLPKAINPLSALDKLQAYQQDTGKDIVFHWAFIKGENDDEQTIEEILAEIEKRDLRGKFNLVRYNPYSARHGEETDNETMERNFKLIADRLSGKSRIVPRVGYDVAASCGMFLNQ